MPLTSLTLLGILPVFLVILAGIPVRQTGRPGKTSPHYLLFLLAVGLLLDLMVLAGRYALEGRVPYQPAQLTALLTPAAMGVLALTLINLDACPRLSPGERWTAAALLVAQGGLVALVTRQNLAFGVYLATGGLFLALAWAALQSSSRITWVGLALLAWSVADTWWVQSGATPAGLAPLAGVYLLLHPSLVVALAAVLVYSAASGAARRAGFAQLALAVLLVGSLAAHIFWASLWDQARDGLNGVTTILVAGPAAIAVGMLAAVKLDGRRRLAGLGFMVLAPLALTGAFRLGWQVSYLDLTAARAGQIQTALERYHAREGRYPQALAELAPRDLLWVPGQLILNGEHWCYQAQADGYRLGAFYRQTFSLPLSLRVYASAGAPAEADWACTARLAELKARYDPPPDAGQSLVQGSLALPGENAPD
ncbi:MAG: hypothetical protein VB089_06450 [Anaerolineaceae bacterium]|nr:hypothetical protein [Anaerolineaceae bacterium]